MNKPFWQNLLAYKAQLTYGRDVGGRLFENYLEIKYEDLLNHPERELSKITNKLGLDFDNGMLEYYQKADEVIVGEEIEWKKNLYRPIMKGNVDKWKNELTSNQIPCSPFLQYLPKQCLPDQQQKEPQEHKAYP